MYTYAVGYVCTVFVGLLHGWTPVSLKRNTEAVEWLLPICHQSTPYVIKYFGPSPPCGVCQFMS